MADDYKSFFLKELESTINRCAVNIMMQPQKTFLGEQVTKVESLNALNDRIAQYNDGIRSLAVYLINTLRAEEDGDNGA